MLLFCEWEAKVQMHKALHQLSKETTRDKWDITSATAATEQGDKAQLGYATP